MGCGTSKDSGTAERNDEARRPESPQVPGGNSTDRPTASDGYQFDAFLSHNWGADKNNHGLVKYIGKRLLNAGVRIWIDEDHLNHGHIKRELIRGVDASRFVVVFITSEYLRKIASEDSVCTQVNRRCAGRSSKSARVCCILCLVPIAWCLCLILSTSLMIREELRTQSFDFRGFHSYVYVCCFMYVPCGINAREFLFDSGDRNTVILVQQSGRTLTIQDTDCFSDDVQAIIAPAEVAQRLYDLF